jgi:hypothetical protein
MHDKFVLYLNSALAMENTALDESKEEFNKQYWKRPAAVTGPSRGN